MLNETHNFYLQIVCFYYFTTKSKYGIKREDQVSHKDPQLSLVIDDLSRELVH